MPWNYSTKFYRRLTIGTNQSNVLWDLIRVARSMILKIRLPSYTCRVWVQKTVIKFVWFLFFAFYKYIFPKDFLNIFSKHFFLNIFSEHFFWTYFSGTFFSKHMNFSKHIFSWKILNTFFLKLFFSQHMFLEHFFSEQIYFSKQIFA